MAHDWHRLTDLTGDQPFSVTQVRMDTTGIAIEGEFELPPLARLSYEDQVFIAEFVRNHGSIKDMERSFGISYPTVKNRLNRIADKLQLVLIGTPEPKPAPAPTPAEAADDVLALLERGEIGAEEAAERLAR